LIQKVCEHPDHSSGFDWFKSWRATAPYTFSHDREYKQDYFFGTLDYGWQEGVKVSGLPARHWRSWSPTFNGVINSGAHSREATDPDNFSESDGDSAIAYVQSQDRIDDMENRAPGTDLFSMTVSFISFLHAEYDATYYQTTQEFFLGGWPEICRVGEDHYGAYFAERFREMTTESDRSYTTDLNCHEERSGVLTVVPGSSSDVIINKDATQNFYVDGQVFTVAGPANVTEGTNYNTVANWANLRDQKYWRLGNASHLLATRYRSVSSKFYLHYFGPAHEGLETIEVDAASSSYMTYNDYTLGTDVYLVRFGPAAEEDEE
jgi:hypothetical protein